jgi:hypothetical protein
MTLSVFTGTATIFRAGCLPAPTLSSRPGSGPVTAEDFSNDVPEMRPLTVHAPLKSRRKRRQRGVVVNFDAADFDPENRFS